MLVKPHAFQEQLFPLVRHIAGEIDTDRITLSNRELLSHCDNLRNTGDYVLDPHFPHEIAETALNLLIAEKYGAELLSSADPARAYSKIIRELQSRLPTQTWRSNAQIVNQQFSTPASIGYLMASLLGLRASDVVLEPSCGTGNLAAWAVSGRARVIANEIDLRRAQLARLLGLKPTNHNAEFIDDLLPPDQVPNVVMMNPPFSSNGGRTKTNSTKFGFRHVESALRRLATGGRFGVVLGASGSPSAQLGRSFWASLEPHVKVFASIEIDGREYDKNGTTVNVVLIVGRKGPFSSDDVRQPLLVQSVEEAFGFFTNPV